jgi:DNA-binding MltR family transcriptional regulator
MYESDRAVILICVSLLDNAMKTLLESLFHQTVRKVKIKENEIYQNNAPLSTFSSKIKMLYLLGLITPSVYQDLEKIRKLRNLAAHDPDHISFSQKKVKLLIESLNCTENFQSGSKTAENSQEFYSFEKDKIETTFAEQKGFVKYHKAIFVIGILRIETTLKMIAESMSSVQSKLPDENMTILGKLFHTDRIWEIASKK